MKRNTTLLEQRREFIKNKINASDNAAEEIKRLSRVLFVSVKTIERDLKQS